MLYLIGLGLCDENDITLRSLKILKECEKVYFESYTNLWFGDLKKLGKLIGKKIKRLKRKDLEENFDQILEEASKKSVAILVPGDPLVATTHSTLILEAWKRKIKTRIIHNSSIISAIAETGIHVYKIGSILTIPLKEKVELPISIYQKIKESKERGLHTLCLLDLDLEKQRFLSVKKALEILLQLEKRFKEKVISEEEEVVIASKLGCKDSKILFGKIEKFLNLKVKVPAAILILGKLHFMEKEFLEKFRLT
jgi:diphthine synthase